MKKIRILLSIVFVVLPSFECSGQEGKILSESPDGKFAVHDRRLERVDGSSSGMFLEESQSGTKVLELPWTKYGTPYLAWTWDSRYLAIAETTRSSYMACYHMLDDGTWRTCEIEDKDLPTLLKEGGFKALAFEALAFNRSGELCVLLSIPVVEGMEVDPEFGFKWYDIKVRRYAVSDDKLKFIDSKSCGKPVEIIQTTSEVRKISREYEGGIFPFELWRQNQFKLCKKMDAKFQMGYYVTDIRGNLNILKIADALPGADEAIVTSTIDKDPRLMALLAPIRKGLKPKLYLIKILDGKGQSAKLDNDQVARYVETAMDMSFDDNKNLYLFCEKDEGWGKVALTIVRMNWEGGIRAEEISRKIVSVKEKQTMIEKMEKDARFGDKPLNLDFRSYGLTVRLEAEAKAMAEKAASK